MMETILHKAILSYANYVIGFVFSIFIVLAIAIILTALCKNKHFNMLNYSVLIVAIPFLTYQISLLYGDFSLKSEIDNANGVLSVISGLVELPTGILVSKVYSMLNTDIWHRILWVLLISVSVSLIMVYMPSLGGSSYNRRSSRYERISRRGRLRR